MALQRTDLLDQARAPFGKPGTSYPTPNIADRFVIEEVPIGPGEYRPLPYHSPHPDYDNNGLILVWQGKVKASNNQITVVRVYSNNLGNDDWYNYSIRYSGDAVTTPIYIRSYIELREDYAALPKGAPLTALMRLQVTGEGTYNGSGTPTVAIVGGGGSGATAQAIMNPAKTKVIGLEWLTLGTGYTSNPTVTFTGGGVVVVATATAAIQPAAAVLVKEETAKLDGEDVRMSSLFWKVNRVYEVLPGPWIPTNRYDDDLGPVQGRKRAVLNAGQVAALVIGGKTTYEGRDESSIVLWELEELWDDAQFPENYDEFWDDERGAVQRVTKLVERTGLEVATLIVSGGVATQITYKGYNKFLLKQTIETWAMPGPVLRDSVATYDDDLGHIYSTRRLVEDTDQVQTETASGRTRYKPSKYGAEIVWQVTESWNTAAFPIKPSNDYDPKRGPVQTVSQVVVKGGTQEGSLDVTAGVAIYIKFDRFTEFLLKKVTETWAVPGIELITRSIGQDNLTPAKYRRLITRGETNQQVGSDYTFPIALTGDQTYIELAEESAALARLKIIQEVIDVDADPLEGEETSEHGILSITEEIVDEGDPADEGFLIIRSSVSPLGNGKSIKITVATASYPVIESQPYDAEMKVQYLQTEQIVAAGTDAAAPATAVVEEIKGKDKYRSIRIITTKSPAAVDYASAIVSEVRRPYKFPGRYDIFGGSAIGRRYMAPAADLVQILIRTWWETGASKPDINSLVSDIFPDTISVIEANPTGEGTRERNYEGVLHDAGYIPGSGIVPATTPTYTQYTGLGAITLLTGTVGYTSGSAVVTGTGTSFSSQVSPGDYFFGSIAVASVGSNTSLTLASPLYFPADASPVSGLSAFIRPYNAGARWIGTERVIGATVVPAKEHNLWKIETQSVIMR